MTVDIRNVRQQLSDINNGHLDAQEKLVSALFAKYPCFTCELVQKAPIPDQKFQCFAYALGVQENEEIRANQESIFQQYGSGWRGLADLLEDRKLAWIKNTQNRCDGDLCIYFDKEVTDDVDYDAQQLHELGVKHAGRLLGKHILSKWGNGHVWKHDVDVVPSLYENQHGEISVLFFRPLVSPQDVAEFLLGFYVHHTVGFRPQQIFIC